MEALSRLFLPLLMVGLSQGLPLAEDQQSDSSVRQLLARLEAELNANKAEIKQLKNILTGSLQGKAALTSETPAFMATLNSRFDHCAKHQPVLFDAVELNQGGGFDNRHGLFRAPTSGTYQISTTLTSYPSGAGYHVAIVKNSVENTVGYLFADRQQNFWQIHSTSIIIHMNAGDDVWIACLSDSSFEGNPSANYHQHYHSHFSGFMISED